jgi:hypothetical protein
VGGNARSPPLDFSGFFPLVIFPPYPFDLGFYRLRCRGVLWFVLCILYMCLYVMRFVFVWSPYAACVAYGVYGYSVAFVSVA